MDDFDATLPVPKPMPQQAGVTATQAGGLLALGAGAFDTRPASTRTNCWEPPSVEALQRALPQYEISAFIARGGMGAVYRGAQRALKRQVAIKIMPPGIEDGELQFASRFKQEAQAMAQLSHPNIVAVFDAGETAEGLLYFVMEFIEGTDVAQLIASHGRLEAQQAVSIISAVCEALAFAHEEGIVHRDIKPSNVMIDKKGRVKVADFGLAKTLNMESTLITRSDVALGTPDFLAPEALIPGMKVDGRVDLYAVGVMLYQMLTGKIPRGRFEMPSGVVKGVNKGFDSVVDRAMQTDRDKRYSTATEMKQDVESLTMPQSGPGKPPPGKLAKARTTKPFLLAAAAVVILANSVFYLMRPASSTSSVPSSPAASSFTAKSYPPGKWVKIWQDAKDIPNVGEITNGWARTKPETLSARLPYSRMWNGGFRARFIAAPDRQQPQLMLRDASSNGYNIICGYGGLMLRQNDPNVQGKNLELKKFLTDLPGDGEEYVLEFIAIDTHLIARLNGKTFQFRDESPRDNQGAGELRLFQSNLHAFRDVEVLNLDGLSKAEALKAAGVE